LVHVHSSLVAHELVVQAPEELQQDLEDLMDVTHLAPQALVTAIEHQVCTAVCQL
jgi:hypothetical protein